MNDARALKDVLTRMGRAAVPVEDESTARQMRDRLMRGIEHRIAEPGTTKRGAPYRLVALAAAIVTCCGALVVLFLRTPQEAGLETHRLVIAEGGRTHVARKTGVVDVETGQRSPLDRGDTVRTQDSSRARLDLGIAIVGVSPNTELSIAETDLRGERLHLARGSVAVEVSDLGPSGSFTVTTPDSRIVVHGTSFTVRVDSATSVAVSSGVVAAHHAGAVTMLRAGDHWSSAPHPTETATVDRKVIAEVPRGAPPKDTTERPRASASRDNRARSAGPQHSRERTTGSPDAAGDLRAQNELFRRAMAAKRSGDAQGALGLLEQLLREYPTAPIAHETRVEQLRLLRSTGNDGAAARAARRYIALYPDGYAAAEARTMLD